MCKVLIDVFCVRANVTADAADVHQGSAAAAAVACVTYCLLSECQAEGGAAAELQLHKGQEVTLPSFTRKKVRFLIFFLFIDFKSMNKQPRTKKESRPSASGTNKSRDTIHLNGPLVRHTSELVQYFFSTVFLQCY